MHVKLHSFVACKHDPLIMANLLLQNIWLGSAFHLYSKKNTVAE
jgi:hypothetical protein